MVLLDWTRMGKQYCLAGVMQQNGRAESACWLMADGFFFFNDPQCYNVAANRLVDRRQRVP